MKRLLFMFIALGSLILGHAAEAQGKYVRILLTNGKTIEFTLNQKPVIKYGTATVTLTYDTGSMEYQMTDIQRITMGRQVGYRHRRHQDRQD